MYRVQVEEDSNPGTFRCCDQPFAVLTVIVVFLWVDESIGDVCGQNDAVVSAIFCKIYIKIDR